MEQDNKKGEIIQAMMDVEYHLVKQEEIKSGKHVPIPMSAITSLGVAFEPLAAAFQNIVRGSGGMKSGLYRVSIPQGGHLAQFKDGSGYIGTVLNANNSFDAQARLNPLVFDPTMLFMAAALMSIDHKLDRIQETQQDILEFLNQKEKSEQQGDLDTLTDILNNYKYNWDNEKFKTNKHILVQEIKRNAAQKIVLYRGQINKKLNKKSLLHGNQNVDKMLIDVSSELKNYQLALYLYSFASFLEVMLLENFESAYLNSVAQKIEDGIYQYRELYTTCYNQIEGYAKSSVETHLLNSIAAISKFAGNVVEKVPLVTNSKMDETLIEHGIHLEKRNSTRAEQTMKQFKENQSSGAQLFLENIKVVNKLYNQPMEILFDEENLYIDLIES